MPFSSVPALREGVPLGLRLLELLLDLLALEAHALALDGLLLDLELADLAVQDVDGLRDGVHLQTQLGGGLVDQVDGLVRQETVVDVAVAEVDGGDEGVVLDAHAVVVLVFLLQAAQDGDGFGGRGLVHHHLLETALQGLVLLEVLLVLVQGGGADGAQLAARERGLEDIGGVHGAGGAACAHQRVDLVDEEDDLAVAVHDFLDHALQPLLEFALVLGACDQRAHVQGEDLAALEVLGHLPVHDLGGDAFRDGGLADTRFADQDRVVLGPPAQDLQHATDFLVAADDRVELSFGRGLVEVHGVLA